MSTHTKMLRASDGFPESGDGDLREVRNEKAPSMITADDLDNLRHMLGVSPRHPEGYRNYFIAGARDVVSMERLRAHGFVVKNDGYVSNIGAAYHATAEGSRAVGLKELPR